MKIFLNIVLALSVFPILDVTYYYYKYFIDANNPLRHEYLEGVALVMVYTWPLWLTSAVLGVGMRNKLSKTHFALSLLPLCFMLSAIITFEFL